MEKKTGFFVSKPGPTYKTTVKRVSDLKRNESKRDKRESEYKVGTKHIGQKEFNIVGNATSRLERNALKEDDVPMSIDQNCFSRSQLHSQELLVNLPTIQNTLKEFIAGLEENISTQVNEEAAFVDVEERDFMGEVNSGSKKRWETQMSKLENAWKENRSKIRDKKIEFSNYRPNKCSMCKQQTRSIVTCMECIHHLCINCDVNIHTNSGLHDRQTVHDGALLNMKPTQFLESKEDGNSIIEKEIPLRVFEPEKCEQCNTLYSMELETGCKMIAVITQEGRFDVHSAAFRCTACDFKREATASEYANSGFWPASAVDSNYFFREKLLSFWSKLKYNAPGTSEGKFVETLSEMSIDGDRNEIINPTLFNVSCREKEFLTHVLSQLVRRDYTVCRACSCFLIAVHADGNFKLYRLESAKDRNGESLFGDIMIVSDEELFEHIKKLDAALKPEKGSSRCGISTFKAARSDASHFKGLDETGIVMMCCRHGTILRGGNMYQGETYRHTHYMLQYAHKLGAKFFCNDVVCHFWPFAKKVAQKLPNIPEFSQSVNTIIPFLSPFHGLGHGWYCRAEFNGHWRKGPGATMGEEMEQCFATMSRYGNSIKHENKAHRRDHITGAMLHWNKVKERKMPKYLRGRFLKAIRKSKELGKKLDSMLEARGKEEGHLAQLLEDLRIQAIITKDQRLSKSWPKSSLQNELEGVALTNQILREKISKFSDGCKARAALRRKITSNKERIKKIVCILEEDHGVIVTDDQLKQLVFPWHDDTEYGKISISQDYALIDVWQTKQRFEEEVILCQREMISFMKSLKVTEGQLLQDEKVSEGASPLEKAKAVCAKTERIRIRRFLKVAMKSFDIDDFENLPDEINLEDLLDDDLLESLTNEQIESDDDYDDE